MTVAGGGGARRAAGLVAGLALLVLLQLAGGWLAGLAHLPLPGSVAGMLLLTIAVRLSPRVERVVRPIAELLLGHMMLFYIPAGVGLMLYGDLLRREWLPVTIAGLGSLVAALVVVGFTADRLERAE